MVVYVKKCCFGVKVVVFGPGGSIRAKWLYSGKSGCVRAKVVVFGQKWLFSGKNCFIRSKRLSLGKSGCIRSKWFY